MGLCKSCKHYKRVPGAEPDGHCLKWQEPTAWNSQRLCYTAPDHPMDNKLAEGQKYHVEITPLLKNVRVTMVVRTKVGPVVGGFLIDKSKLDPNDLSALWKFEEFLKTLS